MAENDRPADSLSLENWADFAIEDLKATPDEQVWNRYAVLKQAEINSMLRLLPTLQRSKAATRIDSLCSAVNGACDPLPDELY